MDENNKTTKHEVKRSRALFLMRHGECRDGQMRPWSLEDIAEAAQTIRNALAENNEQQVHIWYSPLERAELTATELEKQLRERNLRVEKRSEEKLDCDSEERRGVAYAVSRIKRPGVIISHEPNLKAYHDAFYDCATIRRIE